MYLLIGGYKCTPFQIKEWFAPRGVQLTQSCYTVQGNRYLTKHNFRARIRSCDYEGQHSFVVLTHKMPIDDLVALKRTYDRFEENDDARSIKAEMALEDVEFITTAAYIG